jgi:hypothetical protein
VKKAWNYTYTPQYAFLTRCLVEKKNGDSFAFTSQIRSRIGKNLTATLRWGKWPFAHIFWSFLYTASDRVEWLVTKFLVPLKEWNFLTGRVTVSLSRTLLLATDSTLCIIFFVNWSIIIVVVVFQGLGLLACFGSEFIF